MVRHCVPGTATSVDDRLIAGTQCNRLLCRGSVSLIGCGWRSSYRRRGSEDLMMLSPGSSLRRMKMNPAKRGSGSQNQSLSGEVGRLCRGSCLIVYVLVFVYIFVCFCIGE
jgi:hypothetical protein